jgi:hypothetical protein
VGLAVSLVVHIVAIALYPGLMHRELTSTWPLGVPAESVTSPEGMKILNLVETPDEGRPVRPEEPEETKPVEAPTVSPARPDVSESPGTGLVAPGPTAAERIRPGAMDPRLWAPLDSELNALTMQQRLELAAAVRIAQWQDSMAAAGKAAEAMRDWTHTDSQGRKWGVKDGMIYLGDIKIPIPFSFGIPVGKRDEAARNKWEWDEIQRGRTTGEIRDSWKARAEAIRERRDQERAKARPDTTGGGV